MTCPCIRRILRVLAAFLSIRLKGLDNILRFTIIGYNLKIRHFLGYIGGVRVVILDAKSMHEFVSVECGMLIPAEAIGMQELAI